MKTPRRLEPLLEEGIIEEVHRQLMSGKEAACYVVSAGGEIRVAKVYKEAQQRAFQNRATYMEGRNVRNSRDRRAIKKGTNYGKKQLEQAWQSAEVDALFRMHGAGVRVPTPYVFSEGVLLMELVHDGNEGAARRLSEMKFGRQEALDIHAELMRQCALMLLGGLVHADLSEFNVLMAPSGPTIIDFPQAIDAAANNSARRIFVRDTDNLTRYMAHFAPELRNRKFGAHIWKLFERGELSPEMGLELKDVAVQRPQPEKQSRAPQQQRSSQQTRDAAEPRSRRRSVVEIAPSTSGNGSNSGARGGSRGGPRSEARDGGGGEARNARPGDRAPQGEGGGRKRRRRRRGGGSGAAAAPSGAASAETRRSRPDRDSSKPKREDGAPSEARPRASAERNARADVSDKAKDGGQHDRQPRPNTAAGSDGSTGSDGSRPRRRRRRRRRGGGGSAPASGTD